MKTLAQLFVLLTTAVACVTPSTIMVNREGKVVRCATTGYGYGVAGAIAMSTAQQSHDRCVKDAQILGFVPFPPATLGFDADTKSHPMRIIAVKENAEAAGLRPGDLLLEVDSKPVETFFSVITIMNTKKPGDRVAVKIQRDDQVLLRTVVAAGR
jgi:membrane-associated protease RseP (regulator of RpoE activity)